MRAHDLAVSVVLPVFMRERSIENIRFLRRALESIKDQKLQVPHEILVIDDGSPAEVSGCAELLGSASNDVTWVRIQRNGGLVNALNTGLKLARHGLIARLDADDRWLPTKLDKQFALFVADPDLTITATGMARVRPDGSRIDEHVRPGDWDGILRFFVEGGCPFPHGSVVARKEVFHLLGGYPHDARFSHCEDYALWGVWLRFFKPAMVEEALYHYTVSDTSVSSVHGQQQAAASQVVNRRFARGELAGRLPVALRQLAEVLGVPLMEAGRVAYLLWQFRPQVSLPAAALDPLRVILFDREFSLAGGSDGVRPWSSLLSPSCPVPAVGARPHSTGCFYPT